MKARLLSLWNGMNGKQRRLVVWAGGGCVFLAVFFFGSMALKRGEAPAPVAEAKRRSLDIEPRLIEKSQLMESQKEISKRDDEVAALRKEIDDLAREKYGLKVPQPQYPSAAAVQGAPLSSGTPPSTQNGAYPATSKGVRLPPPPPMPRESIPLPPLPSPAQGMQAALPPAPPETELGDIAIVSRPGGNPAAGNEGADKKKDAGMGSVYLPPSFMEATLLSGLDAPTTSEAKGNPVPVLLRVKMPAILPNSVKANLKGCFVIADGKGNLATERAELLLVSLSCLDRRGQAVVDQKIRGFVVDEDGKIGLRGRVVAKMGSMVARSMLAGFFGGAGDALKSSASTLSVSPLGTTQTVEPKDIALAGAGAGMSSGFKEIQKFYMELARQTMPVIEVGATKRVTLVISEGAHLEIKRTAKGGGK